MIESYLDLQSLEYSDSFIISSLTSFAMFLKLEKREMATNKVLWFHKNRYRFASLILCTRIPFLQNLPLGPIRPMTSVSQASDFITSKSYFLISSDRRMSLYWNEVFLFICKFFFEDSSDAETLFMDLLTYLGNLEFVGKINLQPKLYQLNSYFEAQMLIDIEKDSQMVVFPTLPRFRLRESFDSKRRPEVLWDETSFYKQHRELVLEVWEELDINEKNAFLKYNPELESTLQKNA